jgi:hypothetical protein
MFTIHLENLQPQQVQALYNGLMTQPMGVVESLIGAFRQQIAQQEAAMKAQADAAIQAAKQPEAAIHNPE